MDPQRPQGVTFLGVGNMGLAVVLALLKAGFLVTIWNRTTSSLKVETAVAAGAILEPNITKAVLTNPTILICLLDFSTVKYSLSTMPETPSPLTGKIIINLTNGTPRQAETMSSYLRSRGVRAYLDGAIMVTPQMIGGPHNFLVVSGENDSAFSDVRHLLSPIGAPQFLGNETAAASRFDLAALASMYGMFAGSLTGLALLKRGPGAPSISRVVKEQIVPFLTALAPYLEGLAEAWDAKRWGDNMGNPMGMQLQGVKNIVAACKEEGVEAGAMEHLVCMMEKSVRKFGGDSGLPALGSLHVLDK